jgi:hypothetical protein
MARMATTERHLLRGKRGTLRASETGATHPALPAVILLVCFAMFMAAIAPLDFSSIFHRYFPSPTQKVPHQNAAVWVDKTAGVYYCASSIMFGKSHGESMRQVEALDRGYQPALGTYCKGPSLSRRIHHVYEAAPSHSAAAENASPASAAPASPNTFENPDFKPQNRKTPPAGNMPSQPGLPH